MENTSIKLREYVIKSFVSGQDSNFFTKSKTYEKGKWFFNFKKNICTSDFIDLYTEEFVSKYKSHYPFQVCGLESTALPLIGAIAQKMNSINMPINAFYIRKSRKKDGLLNIIEGKVLNTKIISVDDIVNSGSTLIKQYEVLSKINKKIDIAFSVISYRDNKYYEDFYKKYKIKVETVFNLSEVREELNIDELEVKEEKPKINKYKIKWMLNGDNFNYFYVNPKSSPIVYNNNIYYGRSDGKFLCVNADGIITWSHNINYGAMGKFLFSTPLIYKNTVIFGAYDGNVYCLDTDTGKVKWVNFDCDWVGSSPDISIKNNLVYIGAEYGLWRKRGGLIAVSVDTGELVWAYRDMPEYTHSSPLCVDKLNMVFCGSNDGFLYAFDNKGGKLIWKVECGGSVKHRPAYSEGLIVVADNINCVTAFDKNGKKIWEHKMFFGSYCTPKILDGKVYVTSFDKYIYCLDLESGSLIWSNQTSSRIFSSVEIIDNNIYFGSNSGILYEMDKNIGEIISEQIFPERITDKVAYSKDLNTLYVLDYVGNLYSLDISSR